MVLNIAGLLIVFVALIALINMGLAAVPHGGAPLTRWDFCWASC
jgi:CNT family concentrative nucleoside transporter